MKLITRHPIEIVLDFEDGGYIASSDSLNTYACGDSWHAALAGFVTHLAIQRKHYARTPDNELAGLALRAKRNFAATFGAVEMRVSFRRIIARFHLFFLIVFRRWDGVLLTPMLAWEIASLINPIRVPYFEPDPLTDDLYPGVWPCPR